MSSLLDQPGGVHVEIALPATTTATSVASLLMAAGVSLPPSIYGYSVTNVDATNAVLLGFSDQLSPARYYRQVAAAGGSHERTAGIGVLNRLFLRSAADTASVVLVVFA